jgi:uncharacterized protein (TIGR00369 family)
MEKQQRRAFSEFAIKQISRRQHPVFQFVSVKELDLLRELAATQPLIQWIGIELIDAGPGWVKERLPVRPEFLQPSVVHGGLIYMVADTVAAHAILTMIYPKEWTTTVEQKINFLRPATKGGIIGVGRVVHAGNRIVYCEAEVTDDDGTLIAKSVATLMRLTPR